MRKTLVTVALAAGVAFGSPMLAAPAHAAPSGAVLTAGVQAAAADGNDNDSKDKSGRWGLLGLLGLPGLFGYKKYRDSRATRTAGGVDPDGSTSRRV